MPLKSKIWLQKAETLSLALVKKIPNSALQVDTILQNYHSKRTQPNF